MGYISNYSKKNSLVSIRITFKPEKKSLKYHGITIVMVHANTKFKV